MPTEKTLTRAILAWLRTQPDVFAWKVLGSGCTVRGLPDIQGNVGDRALYLEVKTPTGTATPIQRALHRRIRCAGAAVYLVRSLDDAKRAVEEIRRSIRGIRAATPTAPSARGGRARSSTRPAAPGAAASD